MLHVCTSFEYQVPPTNAAGLSLKLQLTTINRHQQQKKSSLTGQSSGAFTLISHVWLQLLQQDRFARHILSFLACLLPEYCTKSHATSHHYFSRHIACCIFLAVSTTNQNALLCLGRRFEVSLFWCSTSVEDYCGWMRWGIHSMQFDSCTSTTRCSSL